MVAHHELIARQGIERILEFFCLRHRKISGVSHPVKLTLEKPLAGCLGEKDKGLGQHEREWRREQRTVHPHDTGRGVFLDAKHRTHASFGGSAIFERFTTEEQSRSGERMIDGPARQEAALPFAIDQHTEILE